MKFSLYIGRIQGVKIYIHWTFFILIAWIAISSLHNNLELKSFLAGFAFMLSIFAMVVLHELGHAVMAKQFKIKTQHITLLPIGGVAQLEFIPEVPKQELLIALAGPAVNIIVAILVSPFVFSTFFNAPLSLLEVNFSDYLFSFMIINLWLAAFNLLPAFPMDGGRVLRALLSFRLSRAKATKWAVNIGFVFGLLFFLLGIFYNVMLLFVGLMVIIGGQYEMAVTDVIYLLHDYTAKDALVHSFPTLEKDLSIQSAAEISLNGQNKNFVVVDHGNPTGTISRRMILQALMDSTAATVDDLKNADLSFATPITPLDEVWKKMQQNSNTHLVLIKHNGSVDGVIEDESLAGFLTLKASQKRNLD